MENKIDELKEMIKQIDEDLVSLIITKLETVIEADGQTEITIEENEDGR